MDRDGTVIAHPASRLVREQVNLAHLAPVREALVGRELSADLVLEGRRQLGSAAPIAVSGWAVLVSEPAEVAFAAWRRLRDALVLTLVAASALGALIGLRSARGMLRPLAALGASTRRVAEGDYQAAGPGPLRFKELEELAGSFDRMVTAVQAREDALARSVSEVRRAAQERERLEQELSHAQRLEAVGRLAGGVAHDFNNLLTVIVGEGHALLEDLPAGDARAGVEGILAAAERASRLTKSLLAHSRKQVLASRPVDLAELVRGVDALVRRVIGEDVAMATRLGEGRLVAVVDPGQIEQVLVNLCTNARDAMPRGGSLEVALERVGLDAVQASAVTLPRAGAYARVTVTDTGTGMDEATLSRLFEPFFTTKPPGQGTGLGLSIVEGITRQHGGAVTVRSARGQGSTFAVYLPLSENPAVSAVAERSPAPPGGHECILLAEDEPLVRRVIARTLTTAGYRVIEAVDGADAVERWRAHRGEVALCMLDVIMPRLNGRDAAEAITREQPGLPVLLASGYTADILEQRGLPPGLAIVAKPLEPGPPAHPRAPAARRGR